MSAVLYLKRHCEAYPYLNQLLSLLNVKHVLRARWEHILSCWFGEKLASLISCGASSQSSVSCMTTMLNFFNWNNSTAVVDLWFRHSDSDSNCEMIWDWGAVGWGIRERVWSDSVHASLGGLLCSCTEHDHTLSGLRAYYHIMNWCEWTRWNKIRPGRDMVWTGSEEGWRLGSDKTTHVALCLQIKAHDKSSAVNTRRRCSELWQ